MYLSEDEIIEHMFLYVLTEEAKKAFRKIDNKNELIQLHSSLGGWIRDRYSMWDEANPYTSGSAYSDKHPDLVSMRIIETIWARMQ